jgi:predicted glycosyltransferase
MSNRRVLLFCHDGDGLGHLRRISRLARVLQQRFSTLVACGMREAGWIVSSGCGLVMLPDWDGIDRRRAERAGRTPWIDLRSDQAARFRAEAIRDVAQLYRPDAVIIDYLPYGQRRELDLLFATYDSLRYFLHRGITDAADHGTLRGVATREIAETYDRILVAADPRVVDIATEDNYCQNARTKLTYVGFVAPDHYAAGDRSRTVVCSGGSGHQAEDLMRQCVAVGRCNSDIPMKVVLGPRSRLRPADLPVPLNCEVYAIREDLPELHRTAAVVVSSGGYNSLLESAIGGARLIVYPSRRGDEGEQRRFAERLAKYHPLHQLENLNALGDVLRANWSASASQQPKALNLKANGAVVIRSILENDLAGQAHPPVTRAPNHQ